MNEPDERQGLPSASGYERIEHCPGSWQLEQCFPGEQSDPLADRGTRIHAAFETGNSSDLSPDEEADFLQGVKHAEMLVAQWQRDFNLDHVEELPRETRIFLHHPQTMDPLCSGRMDRWYRSKDRALVLDLKSGWATHVPPSPRNPQMRVYALCVWKELGISNVRVAIDRAKSRAGADDFSDYVQADLEFAERLLLMHLWAAQQPDAPRYPGKHCTYCKGRAGCSEAACFSLLPGVIAQRAAPDKVKVEQQVGALADADLLKLWRCDTMVRKILDAVDARLKTFPKERLAELGLELPEHGAKNDKIIDAKGCFEFLRDIQQVPEEQLWAALQLNLGQVRDIVREKKMLTEKGAAGWCIENLAQWMKLDFKAPSLRLLRDK